MQKLPEPLASLVSQLSRLPGLGPKAALRCAMTLLKWPQAETRNLGETIYGLRDKLTLCSNCNSLADLDPCPICRDINRDDTSLCLVSEWDSLLTLENAGFYKGRYLILGGLIAPHEGLRQEHLDLEKLTRRLQAEPISEIILALGATLEADNTASFLQQHLRKHFPHLHLTRLAQGIPLGGEVKFMDKETLRQSMQYRQKL